MTESRIRRRWLAESSRRSIKGGRRRLRGRGDYRRVSESRGLAKCRGRLLEPTCALHLRNSAPFRRAGIYAIGMLFLPIYDILNCSINIVQSCLHLLLGVVQEILDILDGLLSIARSCQLIMIQTYFFKALLPRIAAE